MNNDAFENQARKLIDELREDSESCFTRPMVAARSHWSAQSKKAAAFIDILLRRAGAANERQRP